MLFFSKPQTEATKSATRHTQGKKKNLKFPATERLRRQLTAKTNVTVPYPGQSRLYGKFPRDFFEKKISAKILNDETMNDDN
jgi:hypothetical protein